ncbi:MAG: hypothetical protein AAFX99_16970, partial [Myxococcota bacterium]
MRQHQHQHHRTKMAMSIAIALGLLVACGDSSDGDDSSTSNDTASNGGDTTTSNTATSNGSTTVGATSNGTGDVVEDPDRAALTHSFGTYSLGPGEEVQPCVSWTLNNDEPLYIQSVQLANTGAFHHSNWFVVPDNLFEGPDGYFNCSERGFQELTAAVAGTVLFAQSTQSLV